MDENRVDEFLEHYGIKGQRLGIRRTPEQLGHKVSKLKKKTAKLEQKSIDKEKKSLYYNNKKVTTIIKESADKVFSSVPNVVNSGRDFLVNFLENSADTIRPNKK